METTFYDDSKYRVIEDFRMLKRPMTLDLDSVKPSKKQKFTTLLTSPDLNMLKLASPELERLIIAQHGLVTTTPTPNQCMYPKNDNNDQEQYARGFADALSQLHQPPATTTNGSIYHQQVHNEMNNVSVSNSASCSVLPCPPQSTSAMGNFSYPGHSVGATTSCPPMPPVSSAVSTSGPATSVMGNCYAPVSNGYYGIPQTSISIKEEPQTVPCMGVTPPLSPIDMEDQERIKLERKRLRNRIAASKCRRRKLERIARLEDKVALLKGENTELTKVVTSLRDQVCQLKQQVMDHVRCGCEILTSQF